MLVRLFLLLISLSNVYADEGLLISPGLRHSIIIKFDLIVNDDIDENDPRIKSIVYSAKGDAKSKIYISYTNLNAENLALRLAQIFSKQNLLVLKPEYLLSNGTSNNKYVSVMINY